MAEIVAIAGALGVAGFRVDIDPDRFAYTVLGLSMAAAVALVYRLGGGLHGLGRSGVLLFGAALVLLVVGLAYTAALTRWGSPGAAARRGVGRLWMHDHLGAVPRPLQVLLGIPALAWGVTVRDRRRQGWWVCAFGVTATATATTRLIEEGATERTAALGEAYSLVLGLLIAFVAHPRRPPRPGYAGTAIRPRRRGRPSPRAPTPPAPALSRADYTRGRSRRDLEGCRSGRSEPP